MFSAEVPSKNEGIRMNTKNNLENQKLPVNEKENNINLTPEIEEKETKATDPQNEAEPEAVEVEAVPEGTETKSEVEEEKVKPEEPVSPDETVILDEAGKPVEEEVTETIKEEAKSEEPKSETEEPEKESESESEESEIDYDLEDAVDSEDSEDSEDDDVDENSVSDDGDSALNSIEDIVGHLRILLEKGTLKRKHVDDYKNQFYRSLRNEIESQKQKFIADGGEEIDFVANEPDVYAEGKGLLQKIKEKRADMLAEENARKEKNVARKLSIINQIKLLTETQGHEDFNKTYQEFKSLQNEWNEIKLIPQSKVNELWKSYQRYVEKFYDLVRINNEFREYDFKKNLELKTELCVSAERLDEEPDVVSAFHQLQNLHQEWREVGPVSRRDREEIWNRFKEASTLINKKYQGHFEGLREKEDENLELKTAICEKLEAIDYSKIKTVKDWNRNVKEVLELQSQWRRIGYVPRKWNTKIYKRYRATCDLFFKTKNEFYKSLRGEMEENLKKKIELCERAEAMKESTDWKKTTQDMIDIQKEWKTIGIIPRKHVDPVWKRFITACDYFFEQKKKQTSSRYEEENRNLEAKKAVVESIKNIDTSLSEEKALSELRELMDQWYVVGHVPYKLKDSAYHEFYTATEEQFDRLNIDKTERKMETFKTNLSDITKSGNAKNQLLYEREKLMRQYDRKKGELQTYENNIGFLSVSSKKGNTLLDDMHDKVEKIKTELQLIVRKVEALDKEL